MTACISMKRTSGRNSDEGYNSDLPSPQRDVSREELKVIHREVKEFKEKYFVEKLLNNSANGVIYKGYRKFDGKSVCIKQVPKTRITQWADCNGRIIPKEFEMHLRGQRARGVVRIYDWYERKTSFVLVMEKPTDSKDFFEVSKEYGAIRECPARIIFRQVVETCQSLHSRGVFHRDIKDENILINMKTLETKVIDFGCATDFSSTEEYDHFSGTPEFCAPEIFNCGKYRAEQSTVWTLGTLLHVILLGDIPFEKTEDITAGRIRDVSNMSKLSSDGQSLLKRMLKVNPAERPTITQLLDDKWLNL